jgi:CRP-like cAMP-binding protein
VTKASGAGARSEERRGSSQKADLRAKLRRASLFEGLGDAHLDELIAGGRKRTMEAGQNVFMQGDRANGMFVVLRGRIRVFKVSRKGREQTLMIMGPGEPVGEVAVLSGENYPASAETMEAGEALYIPRQAFLDLVAREPEVALRLLSSLSARLRSFASLIEDLSLKDVVQRLAAYLLSLADAEGDGDTLRLGMTKNQLSATVGTVPETLSRAFQQLTRAGALETTGRTVQIRDRKLLEHVAGVK